MDNSTAKQEQIKSNTEGLKENKKYSKSQLYFTIFLIFPIFIILGLTLINKHSKIQSTTTTNTQLIAKDQSTIQITPLVRAAYDFNKILNEKFITFENKDLGFSINYPPEEKPQIFNAEDAKSAFGAPGADDILGGWIYGLVSQVPGAYEIYDGFTFKIVYFKKPNNGTLEELVKKEGNGYDKSGFGNQLDSTINIDNNTGWKLTSCCSQIQYYYYFPLKNGDNFIRIEIYSAGQDREKFLEVANRMLESIKFFNK